MSLRHTRFVCVTLAIAATSAACSRACDSARPSPSAPAPTSAEAPEAASAPSHSARPVSSGFELPFIADDYARARAEAKRESLPLFVDVWASWCHTCASLKEYVLRDPALLPVADRFVWLSIDSERPSNAEFLRRFPSKNVPTLWVIDPQTETPVLKWIGTATASELRSLLEDALHDSMLADLGAGRHAALASAAAEASALASHAHRLAARSELPRAIEAYRRAIQVAPPSWPKRARILEALSMRMAEMDQHAALVELAAREAGAMPDGTPRLNVLVNGIAAAARLPAGAPEHALVPELVQLGTRIATTPTEAVLLDDRSNLSVTLIRALERRDPAEAKRLARGLAETLETAAARAPDAAARMVWDAHRLEAYLAIGEPERAVPMLEQSERDRPEDFNPPARLARVYLKLARLPQARAAIDRALERSAGPRTLRLYVLKADILLAAKDKAGARRALRDALAFARRSQLPPHFDALRETIERRVRELS